MLIRVEKVAVGLRGHIHLVFLALCWLGVTSLVVGGCAHVEPKTGLALEDLRATYREFASRQPLSAEAIRASERFRRLLADGDPAEVLSLYDPHPRLRIFVLRYVVEKNERGAVAGLIARLAAPDPGVVFSTPGGGHQVAEIADALSTLTGADEGLDKERWDAWWSEHRGEFPDQVRW